MYIIGIVGRVYQNKDNQPIIQVNDYLRRYLLRRKDVTCITILPSDNKDYLTLTSSKDKINKQKINTILDICDAFIIPGGTNAYNIDEYVIKYAYDNNKIGQGRENAKQYLLDNPEVLAEVEKQVREHYNI